MDGDVLVALGSSGGIVHPQLLPPALALDSCREAGPWKGGQEPRAN